jgi:hypothetical protein
MVRKITLIKKDPVVLYSLNTWQQDGSKPQQANMVMDWLESIFEERMLIIRARRGDSWAPYSLDMNPCDSLIWSDLKEVFYKPLIYSLLELKDTIKRLIKAISEVMVRKLVYGKKERAANMIQVEGITLEGDEISSKINYE